MLMVSIFKLLLVFNAEGVLKNVLMRDFH